MDQMTNFYFRQTTISFEETAQPLSLYQLNMQIKEELEDRFAEAYWVIAEVAEVNAHRGSGHCYLSLVDKAPGQNRQQGRVQAQARATIWSNRYQQISRNFERQTGQALKAGLKILISAKVRFHELYGLSLDILDIDPQYTIGDLARQRQETINRLVAEGLFDRNREQELAPVPQRLAVISSATAAGYQDFMHQLEQNPYGYRFQVRLFPAIVQGNEAPASVTRALQLIAEYQEQFDAVILIRGGGSTTDLQCFDSYDIAAAIAMLPLPVLTGIGHERDETVADLVAHTRLKTPTAAADFVVEQCRIFEEETEELFFRIRELAQRKTNYLNDVLERQGLMLSRITNTYLNLQRNRVNQLAQGLLRKPKEFLAAHRHEVNCHEINLVHASESLLNRRRNTLGQLGRQLEVKSRQLLSVKDQHLQKTGQCLQTEARKLHAQEELRQSRFAGRLVYGGRNSLQQNTHRLDMLELKLKAHDPEQLLLRGYTLTFRNGKLLRSVQDLQPGDVVETRFADGRTESTIKTIQQI